MTVYKSLKRPAVIAHRGASAHAPENTLAAFKLAIQQHADGIELDARLCADGQVVVIHDDTVDRTTFGTGRVNAMSLAELKLLDASSKFHPTYQSERIPTLVEVFETVGDQTMIVVELKNLTSPLDDLPDRVVSLVEQHSLEERVILSSFNPIALIKARDLNSKIPLALLTIAGLANAALHSKLVPFGPLLALHAIFCDVTPELISAIHREKSVVYAYSAEQPEQMQQLFRDGVDGIITVNPPLALEVLGRINGAIDG